MKQQVIFWTLIATILIMIFGQINGRYIESFYFVSFLLPVAIGTSVIFNHYLVPKYLLAGQRFQFGLYLLYLIIFSLYFEMLVLTISLIVLANYNYADLNPYTTNLTLLTSSLYLIVFVHGFMTLIKKYQNKEIIIKSLEENQTRESQTHIIFRVDRKQVPLAIDQILYIESLADYLKVYSSTETLITKEKISGLDKRLPSNFLRVHRSFIVNVDRIDSYNSELISIGKFQIPISRSYRKEVTEKLVRKASL